MGLPGIDTFGDPFLNTYLDEKTTGAHVNLVYKGDRHTGVLGFDYERGELDSTIQTGDAIPALRRSGRKFEVIHPWNIGPSFSMTP